MEKNKKISNNGYEYVDLGLPSGTLWATCNVGASKPSDAGLYFQWGDIKGYTKEQVGKEKKFKYDFSDYKFSIDGSNTNFSKYATKCETLGLEDDAAHVNMGGDWHMPTPDQINELLDNTASKWITMDGVNGRRFTSKNGKSIFIPAAGYAYDGAVQNSGAEADVWSSMLYTDFVFGGQYLHFISGNAYLNGSYRYFGFSVRGVIDKNMNLSELIKNEIKNNFKVKVNTGYGGNVNVELLYDGEVISSDVCSIL